MALPMSLDERKPPLADRREVGWTGVSIIIISGSMVRLLKWGSWIRLVCRERKEAEKE